MERLEHLEPRTGRWEEADGTIGTTRRVKICDTFRQTPVIYGKLVSEMKVIKLSPAERAAVTRKWRRASAKAQATARNAKLFARYALGKKGWKVASLDSRDGFEYKGVVDLVAVKRNNRSPDELTVMLVQVKGGSARVTKEELSRLRKAVKRVQVTWNVAAKPAKSVQFRKSLS